MRNEAFMNIEHLAEVAIADEYGEVRVSQKDLREVWNHLCELHGIVSDMSDWLGDIRQEARKIEVSCDILLRNSK